MRLVRIATDKIKKLRIFYPNKEFHFFKSWSKNNALLSYMPQVLANFHKSENVVKHKIVNLRQWHEEFTGLDEVRAAQNRVLEAENKFITAQETRRAVNNKLAAIQNRLREIYAELDKTKRGEERYVFLITQEHAILKEERTLAEEFQKYEIEEREQFSILSSALKESHEKERLQAERTKYWSIIGSVIGTVIGIIGSSIINEMRMRELRNLMSSSTGTVHEQLKLVVEKLQQQQVKHKNQMQFLHSDKQGSSHSTSNDALNSHQNVDLIVDLLNKQHDSQQKWTLSTMAVLVSVVIVVYKFLSNV